MSDRGAKTNTPSLSFKQEREPPRHQGLQCINLREKLSCPDTRREIMGSGAPRS